MTANSPLTPRQVILLKIHRAMTPAARDMAKTLANILRDPNVSMVMKLYDVGNSARVAYHDEGTYGTRVIEQLASYLEIRGGRKRIYELIKFAKCFARDFVERTTKSPGGAHLSVEHWEAIATVRDIKLRHAMLTRAIEQGLSVKELLKDIKAIGKPIKQIAKRPPPMTPSPVCQLHKHLELIARVVRKAPEFGRCVFDPLLHVSVDKIDERFKALLERAKSEVHQGRVVLQAFEGSLDTILRRVDEVLEKRKSNAEMPTSRMAKATRKRPGQHVPASIRKGGGAHATITMTGPISP